MLTHSKQYFVCIPNSFLVYIFYPFLPIFLKGSTFALKIDNLKRNHIQFWYGKDRDVITLISNPQFIRIHISRQGDCDSKLLQGVSPNKKID